jgi:beta-xylosidase
MARAHLRHPPSSIHLRFLVVLALVAPLRAADTYCNPLDVLIADPFVLRHDNTYYLYGTLRAHDGFDCWTSTDLVRWRLRGPVYQRNETDWPRTMFWAAECFEHHGKFYLHGSAIGDVADRHRLFLAEADSPLGPFKIKQAPWGDLGKTVIDGDVFRDTDGRLYLYYVLDARENRRSEIYVRKLNDDLLSFDGPPAHCIHPEQGWEGTLINEGPFVLKHRGTYYLMYSGNGATDPWYAVGYAAAASPLGPWKKFAGNPILRRTKTISGPGHHSVIESPDGKELFIVYHTHQQPSRPTWARQLAIDRLTFQPGDSAGADVIVIKGPTDTPQPMPSGAAPLARGQSDEFDAPDLDRSRWTVFNERPPQWRMADGALRITAQGGDVRGARADLRNLFLTLPPRDGDFSVTTRVRFNPTHAGEQAFLCLWQNHNDFLRLAVTRDDAGTRQFEVATECGGEWTASDFEDKLGDELLLRIDVIDGSVRFHVSGDGGKHWTVLSKPTKFNLLAARIGLGATAGPSATTSATSATSGPQAAFDFLHFSSPDP